MSSSAVSGTDSTVVAPNTSTGKRKNVASEILIPQASVARIIKSILPNSVQVGKCAKQAFARAAGIFVLYATATANEFCKENKRQTISAQDVLSAMEELDFDDFLETLQSSLEEYRADQNKKKQVKKMQEKSLAQSREQNNNNMDVDPPVPVMLPQEQISK
eukprot:GSMAST32.ASY1.ANO1.766.1 assembled CDS